jgi:sugar O-acyltransferase (sialic acid O-acetyltransferase NeuD family)
MDKKTWYIYGTGGLGRECFDIAYPTSIELDLSLEFIEDEPLSNEINGVTVSSFDNHKPNSFITIAVGEPNTRSLLLEKILSTSLKLKSAISKESFISPTALIQEGSIVAPLCSIQANSRLETNSLINTMSIVGHDCHVQSNSVLSSKVNLGGSVVVGSSSFIGMGALIKENIQIGDSVIIGMSSVVYRDIQDSVIAIGNPARVAKKNDDKKVFKKKEKVNE